jgi:hypothetical protein
MLYRAIKMTYIIYFFLAFISLPITLLGLLLAPVLPLFAANEFGWLDNHAKQGFGPRLPRWLSLFMTPDNSLDGDATFERLNGTGYFAKVKWLCRNPAYSFALKYLSSPYQVTVAGDISIKDNDKAKAGWCFVTANNLFQFRWVCPIGFSRCIYCNFGHNIFALADPNITTLPDVYQATFVFSPRISGFR